MRLAPVWIHLLIILIIGGGGAEAASAGRLELSYSPEKLTLGEVTQAEIRIRVLGAYGAPVDGAEVRLRTNAGSIGKITPAGPGEHIAAYIPPSTFFPRFALVAAVARTSSGTIHGFLVLPLWGAGEAVVRSRPGASVNVRIGDRSFGPVTAGSDGQAHVPLIVPPGIHEAQTGARTIDLKIPPASRVVTIAERESVASDGSDSVTIRIYSITDQGQPALDLPLVSAGRGKIGPPRQVGPGIFAVAYTTNGEIGEGVARIEVSLPGDPISRDAINVRLAPGSVQKITLAPERNRHLAGKSEKIRLVIELQDKAGNPSTEVPELQASLGTVDDPRLIGPGMYEAQLTPPDDFQSQKKLQIVARVQGTRASSTIELLPGPAQKLELFRPKKSVLADGTSSVDLSIEARDAFGNLTPLPGDLSASAAPGSAAVVDSHVQFTPPLRRIPEEARVKVQSGAMTAEVPLNLVPMQHWLELGALVGLHSNLGNVLGLAVALRTAVYLGFPGLSLLVEGGYLRSENDSASQGIEARLEVAPLLGTLTYRLFVHRRVHISVGAGGGAYFVRNVVQLRDQPEETRHHIIFGFHGDVGLGVHLGPGYFALDTRLSLADVSAPEIVGNVGGLQVLLGYQLGLF